MATVAAAFGSIAACSGLLGGATEVAAKTPAQIVVVQGANQSVQAGKDLPTPIVFRVLDSAGAPVAGVTVSLAVKAGGGTVPRHPTRRTRVASSPRSGRLAPA